VRAAARDRTASGATPDAQAYPKLNQPPRDVSGNAVQRVVRILGVLSLLIAAGMAGPVLARSAANGDAAAAARVKSGTGFSVSRDGFVVTSAHVVEGCQNISVLDPDGTGRPGYVIAADRRLDVALLWAEGRVSQYAASAAAEPPRAGAEVFTLGFGVIATEPLHPVLIEGSLVGDSTAKPGNRILVIRAKLHAGNSGGAVLIGNGSLVGMIVGRDEEHPELGVAIPLTDVERLLYAYGIALPRRSPEADPRAFLGAISVLIQCTGSSSASPDIPPGARPSIPGPPAAAAGKPGR
jgi:S1-C subfamily serine protease